MVQSKKVAPFPLAYLDWCKNVKKIKTLAETENRELVVEFYNSQYWNRKEITGIDLAICLGIVL